MTRIRTHKAQYAIVSNSTAQDNTLSFAALGFLTYCLSMPENWDFYPQVIWKQRTDLSRNRAYALFDELIETYHCIRIRAPNPKAKGLPGAVSYEMFDDPEMCKKRIQELENTGVYLEHGGNFKLCFRRSNSQNAGEENAARQHLLKKQDIKETPYKETPLLPDTPEPPEFVAIAPEKSSLRSSEQGASPLDDDDPLIYKYLENTNLSPGQKKTISKQFSAPDIARALKMIEGKPVKSSQMGMILHALKNPDKWEETTKGQNLTPQQQIALQYNAKLATLYPGLAKENEHLIAENKGVWVYIDIMRNIKTTLSFAAYDYIKDINHSLNELKKVKVELR